MSGPGIGIAGTYATRVKHEEPIFLWVISPARLVEAAMLPRSELLRTNKRPAGLLVLFIRFFRCQTKTAVRLARQGGYSYPYATHYNNITSY